MFEDSDSLAKGANFGDKEKFHQTEFSPRDYLATYYPPLRGNRSQDRAEINLVIKENKSILSFYAQQVRPLLQSISSPRKLLEIGGGPTIHQLISICPTVEEIVFTDYLVSNLEILSEWVVCSDSFWETYVAEALFLESQVEPSLKEVKNRELLLKKKLLRVCQYDVITNQGLNDQPESFAVVCSNFCLESITGDRMVWKQSLANLCQWVTPKGQLVITALRQASSYRIGNSSFPAVPLIEQDIYQALLGLSFVDIRVTSNDCSGSNGYNGIMYVTAQKG